MPKTQLLRDGQIVGYERTIAGVTERSYDNQTFERLLEIPHDDTKAFVSFDATNLVEVYED